MSLTAFLYVLSSMISPGKSFIETGLNISPVMDENKKFFGASTTSMDDTRLKARQKRIYEQEKLAAIEHMAAGLAHEIKNPLTTIKGFAQLLREKYTADPVLTGYVEIILGEVDRSVGVLNDFLEFARPRQPKLIKKSIKKLLDEFLTLFEPQSFMKNIIIQYESAAGLPDCVVDVHQIKQVLFNICKNAVEAMPGGGTLSFRDGLAGEEIYLDIHDTGCGIPKEILKDIGVPFYTTKDNGTGLGLSISYAIIEAHRGRVEIESSEGRGTRFRLYLPVTYSSKDMGTQ